jgi:hypothetical protein
MNLPPTGREVIVPGVEVFGLSNQRIVELLRHDDDAGLLRLFRVLTIQVARCG